MSIKVISYTPSPYGDFQLGFCTVELKGKSRIIVKVCKSQKGTIFCAATSVKIGDKWTPTLQILDSEGDKKFFNAIKEQVVPMINVAPKTSSHISEDPNPSDNDLPF